MPPSNELAKSELRVPDLVVPSDSVQIESDDIALPRIKLGQPNSSLVPDTVPKHCIFATNGSEDPDPAVLYEYGDEQGVLVHVLGMRKSWSLTDFPEKGDLTTWQWNDPTRHKDAWKVYNFVLALPEVDPDVPYKMLFTKTATACARNINTVLARNAGRGPSFMSAFRITTDERSKQDGSKKFFWTVPLARPVDATQKGVDASAALYQNIAGTLDNLGASNAPASDASEPSI